MSKLIKIDKDYAKWIQGLSVRFRNVQIKAATKVNQEMLMFYWSLGEDIVKMKKFYLLYSLKSPQLGGKSDLEKTSSQREEQLLCSPNRPQVGGENDKGKETTQIGEKLLQIPWGHHKCIIDKCGSDFKKAMFYVDKVIENNWLRAVLLNWLSTDLYKRQGRAINNFSSKLPLAQGDLAKEITKDPYNFDFLTIAEGYNEKELKDALEDNIVKFLLELGSGFAFVGREYRLQIGKTEKFVDLLFYNIKLHCYVVVEVKTNKFD